MSHTLPPSSFLRFYPFDRADSVGGLTLVGLERVEVGGSQTLGEAILEAAHQRHQVADGPGAGLYLGEDPLRFLDRFPPGGLLGGGPADLRHLPVNLRDALLDGPVIRQDGLQSGADLIELAGEDRFRQLGRAFGVDDAPERLRQVGVIDPELHRRPEKFFFPIFHAHWNPSVILPGQTPHSGPAPAGPRPWPATHPSPEGSSRNSPSRAFCSSESDRRPRRRRGATPSPNRPPFRSEERRAIAC